MKVVREGAPTAATRVWEVLNNPALATKRWLLVFDNVDDPAVLAAPGTAIPADYAGWLREDPTGFVIVTTRIVDPNVWGSRVTFRILNPLTNAAAAQVLADLAPDIADPTGDQAKALGDRLGGLPLALHLAGTYLASPFTRWHSFVSYQQALNSVSLPQAIADLDHASRQARDSIQGTWDLSLDALTAEGRPQARALLLLLSCYAPATPIPVALLQGEDLSGLLAVARGPSPEGTSPEGAAATSLSLWSQVREGLQGLSAVGLAGSDSGFTNSGARAVTLHPVVVDVNRSRLLSGPETDLHQVSQAAVALLHSYSQKLDTTLAADWPAWNHIVPHLSAVLEWLAAKLDVTTLIRLLDISNRAGDAMWRSGNLGAAERLARLSANGASQLGDDHPTALTSRYILATTVIFQGRYAGGEHIYSRVPGSDPERNDAQSDAWTIRADPQRAAEWLSRYQEAEAMLRKLLPVEQRVRGEEHRETLTTRHRLAWVIGLQGHNEEAERMFRPLFSDQRRLLGNEDRDTLSTGQRLAWVIAMQGRYAEAEEMFRAQLPHQFTGLGERDSDTLSCWRRLAWVIGLQGRNAEAEEILRRILPDEQRVLGDDHPDTMSTRHRFALAVRLQGRDREAEEMYMELLPDEQRLLGDDHPDTVATRYELAQMLTSSNRKSGNVIGGVHKRT